MAGWTDGRTDGCIYVRMCACTHVRMYACMHVCMCVCMCMCICICICICVCVCVCVCICICVCVCVCVCMYVRTYACTCKGTCICTYMYVRKLTPTIYPRLRCSHGLLCDRPQRAPGRERSDLHPRLCRGLQSDPKCRQGWGRSAALWGSYTNIKVRKRLLSKGIWGQEGSVKTLRFIRAAAEGCPYTLNLRCWCSAASLFVALPLHRHMAGSESTRF